MPDQFTPEWYEATIRALLDMFQQAGRPPALDTGARMLHMVREQGKSIADVQAWFAPGPPPQPARHADMIDLHTATVHSSPMDIADWPATVRIVELELFPGGHPRNGLNFTFDRIPDTWDFHMPGWGGANDPGNILYTVWALVRVGGQWHAAAFIQMWRGRPN